MRVEVISRITEKTDDKPPTAWDRHGNSMTIRQLIRPSLISMAACGCYTYDGYYIRDGRETAEGRPYRIFGIVYRTVTLLVCLTALAKAVAAFTTLSSNKFLHFNALMCIWITLCLVIFLISLKSNHSKYGGQKKAIDFWDTKLFQDMEALGIVFPAEKIRQRQNVLLAVAVSVCIFNVICLSILSADVFSEEYDIFYSAPFSRSVPVLVIGVFMFSIITLIWCLPVFYIILMSYLLTVTFEAFNDFLEAHIEKHSLTMTNQFQRIRTFHLNLCKMVTHLDQDFGWYFAALFVFSIGLACFILYQLIKTSMDTMTIVTFCFWMIGPLVQLGSASVFAAFLNEAVSILLQICDAQ